MYYAICLKLQMQTNRKFFTLKVRKDSNMKGGAWRELKQDSKDASKIPRVCHWKNESDEYQARQGCI